MIPGDAQRLLEDPAFVEVWNHMEKSIIRAMKRSKMTDLDTHHELVLSLQVMENFQKVLQSWAEGDNIEEFNTKLAKAVW